MRHLFASLTSRLVVTLVPGLILQRVALGVETASVVRAVRALLEA